MKTLTVTRIENIGATNTVTPRPTARRPAGDQLRHLLEAESNERTTDKPLPGNHTEIGDTMYTEDDELLTTAEVAAITRAPASTVRYWRHLGTGPASFRVGRRVVYRRGDVAQWLRDQQAAEANRSTP